MSEGEDKTDLASKWREEGLAIHRREARNAALEEALTACKAAMDAQAKKRDATRNNADEWQIYNHGAFIAAGLVSEIAALKAKP